MLSFFYPADQTLDRIDGACRMDDADHADACETHICKDHEVFRSSG